MKGDIDKSGRGEYIAPSLKDNREQEQQKQERSQQRLGQSLQIDGNFREHQIEESQNKIFRKSYLTSDTVRQDTENICFDGIRFGLMGAMNLFAKDNFTSFIVRGIQARNPNVGVVQILANSNVQKSKNLLNTLRIQCWFLLLFCISFLIFEIAICIQHIPNEQAPVITLLMVHLTTSIVMSYTAYASARYFLPQRARVSSIACVLMLVLAIGIVIAKTDETHALPNSFSVLLFLQFLVSGLLLYIHQQIFALHKIFL